MQKSIQVPDEKKTAAVLVLTGTFGMTIADDTKKNILVVEGTDEQWKLFDAASQAAGAAGSSDAWASLKLFGGIVRQYGISALKGVGSGARGIISFLGSDVTKTTLTETAHVAAKATTTVAEVGMTTVVATANTLCDESREAWNRVTKDPNYQGLKDKVVSLFAPKVNSLW